MEDALGSGIHIAPSDWERGVLSSYPLSTLTLSFTEFKFKRSSKGTTPMLLMLSFGFRMVATASSRTGLASLVAAGTAQAVPLEQEQAAQCVQLPDLTMEILPRRVTKAITGGSIS